MTESGALSARRGILAGVFLLAAMQTIAELATSREFIGGFIYNYYFLSLIDGKLTVPAQIAGLEGFYDSEGRAFLYHGLGPLITRALASPFVDLTAIDLRAPTIWLFASVGSGFFYLTAVSLLRGSQPEDSEYAAAVRGILWLMVWVLAPGLVLSGNGSFFHEPVAFAFAASGGAIYCLWRLVDSQFTGWRWLLGMALAGALAVHGRPHVAVGIYAATVLAAVILVWRTKGRGLLPAGAAMLILLMSGLAYLQMNALRFGSMASISGTVGEGGAVYGFLYWGWESVDHPRFQSNENFGRFYSGRILPNLFLYAVSMGGEASVWLFRRMTSEMGYVRIEPPVLGFLLLWLPWCVLAVAGLARRAGELAFFWLGLAATLPGAIVMLSYTTVTMRYRMELWPVLFVPAIIGLAAMLETGRRDPQAMRRIALGLGAASVAAVVVGGLNTIVYLDILNWEWGTALKSYDDCAVMVAEHPDLGPDRIGEICALGAPAH